MQVRVAGDVQRWAGRREGWVGGRGRECAQGGAKAGLCAGRTRAGRRWTGGAGHAAGDRVTEQRQDVRRVGRVD